MASVVTSSEMYSPRRFIWGVSTSSYRMKRAIKAVKTSEPAPALAGSAS